MKREIRSIGKSFKNAFRGIASVLKYERNFRIHICMMVYVLIFSIIGRVESSDISRFIICFGLVMGAELFNTSIELLADAVSKGFDERIRDIKDVAAGAVLICAIAAATVGLCVFLRADVFGRIIAAFIEMPYLAIVIVVSIPIALRFIIKRGK